MTCFARFSEANPECDPQPEWAHGALCTVPVTKQDIQEAQLALKPHHTIALEEEVPLIREALAEIPKRQRRPKLSVERQWKTTATQGSNSEVKGFDEALSSGEGPWCDADVEVVLLNTFLTVRSITRPCDGRPKSV